MVPTVDGGEDAVGVGGPDEGLGIVVGLVDEAVDGGLEVDDGAEHAASEPAPGQLGEEALDAVEPGRRGGREVKNEPGVALQPIHDLGMLVGGIVVEDDMDGLARRKGGRWR